MKKIVGILLLVVIIMMGCVTEEKEYKGTIVLMNNVDMQLTVRIDGSEYSVSANSSVDIKVELENSSDEEAFEVEYKISGREDYMQEYVILSEGSIETVIVNPGNTSYYTLESYQVDGNITGDFSGTYFDIDWYNNVTFEIPMLENEDSSFSLNYSGRFVFEENEFVNVEEGFDYTYNIYPNCGEIVIENQSSFYTIVEVYISPSTDTSWGLNDLEGTIYSNQSVTWKAEQGSWDIKFVDNEGTEYFVYEEDLYIEGSLIFALTDGKNDSTFTSEDRKVSNTTKYAGETAGGRLELVK